MFKKLPVLPLDPVRNFLQNYKGHAVALANASGEVKLLSLTCLKTRSLAPESSLPFSTTIQTTSIAEGGPIFIPQLFKNSRSCL